MYKYRILLAMLALVICTGTASAANKLTVTLGPGALSCNTATGGSGSVVLTYTLAAGVTGAVGSITATSSTTGLLVGTPTPNSLNSTGTKSGTVTITASNICAAPTSGSYAAGTGAIAATITFSTSFGGDVTQALNVSETATATSPLSFSPNAITISCILGAGGSYTGNTTTFSISTTATVAQTATVAFPTGSGWLGLNASALTGAGPYPVPASGSIAITATAACASIGGIGSSKTAILTVTTALPEPATVTLSVPITATVVGPSQLSVTGTSPNGSTSAGPLPLKYSGAVGYTIGSGNFPTASLALSSPVSSLYYMVDMTTMPGWLTVSSPGGQLSGGAGTLTFTATKLADSLTPGVYTTGLNGIPAIALKVGGQANTLVYISLTVQAASAQLTVQGATTQNLSWSLGQPFPSATVMLVSSGTPVAFTTTVVDGSNPAGASPSPAQGLAYSFGTPVNVAFNVADFGSVAPGTVLSSQIQFNWKLNGASQTTTVTFLISIQAPSTAAILTGIAPQYLPSGAVGQTFAVTLYGSGFIPSNLSSQATFVGVVPSTPGQLFQKDNNIVVTVNSSMMMTLTVTVPSGDALLPFNTPNSMVTLGVCNPNGSTSNPPCLPQSTITLNIDSGPVISSNGVTSGSTFVSAAVNGLAPYDIVSIFGTNFCVSNGTGCGPTQTLISQPVNGAYPLFATPDPPSSPGQRFVQVFFCPSTSTAATVLQTGCSVAPVLFATNTQINAIVPGAVLSATSASWNVYVRFGTAITSSTTLGSGSISNYQQFTAPTTGMNPGVFIVDGSDDGAIVVAGNGANPNVGFVTNNTSQAARIRPATGTLGAIKNSDSISIYMTGLGVPPTAASSPAENTNCQSVALYAANVGLTATNPNLDGVILDPTNFSAAPVWLPPCFFDAPADTAPVSINVGSAPTGGYQVQPTTMLYAGWVANSVAGLYQVNVQLPDLSTTLNKKVCIGTTTATCVVGASGPAPIQVPVTVMAPGTTGQIINMYVQPAMAFTASKSVSAPMTISNGVYSVPLTNLASSPTIDTVTANGGNGTPVITQFANSIEATSTSSTYFTVTAGVVKIINGGITAPGTYTVTLVATDSGGSALAPEYITLTIIVT